MIKKTTPLAMTLLMIISMIPTVGSAEDKLQLQQVVIMSRDQLRVPLTNEIALLQNSTTKNWPHWGEAAGQLTTRGGVLEIYTGHYTRQWLAQQGLVKAEQCPESGDIFAYANSIQSTLATAQFFVTGAFPGCDVTVTHQDNVGSMDPIFNPIVTGLSKEALQKAQSEIAASANALQPESGFRRLEQIVNYKNSPFCKGKKKCDLHTGSQNVFSVVNDKQPTVTGPLYIGYNLINAFTWQNYQGLPISQVAWGQVESEAQWKELLSIKNGYLAALFTPNTVARIIAAPLVDYIRSQMAEQDNIGAPKVTLLVGNDANITSLLSALDFEPFDLPGQPDHTPPGGKIIFERWYAPEKKQNLLKVEYVYQSVDQLRKAEPLSSDNPPKRVTLTLQGCETESAGFCPWQTFTMRLNHVLQGTPLNPPAEQSEGSSASGKQGADESKVTHPMKETSTVEKPAESEAPVRKTEPQQTAGQGKTAADGKAVTDKPANPEAEPDKAKSTADDKQENIKNLQKQSR